MRAPVIESTLIELITIPDGRREIDWGTVNSLAASMALIGLREPITVRTINDRRLDLVVGNHRLEAAKKLGWNKIDCCIVDWDEIDSELWEIAENLHRAELTVLRRSMEIARWVELVEMKARATASGREKQPHEKGHKKASQELNVSRFEVQRAVKVSNLTAAARDAAIKIGLDDNQSALLAAASVDPVNQVQALHDFAEAKRQAAERRANIPVVKDWTDVEAEQFKRLATAWNAASPAVKERFREHIDAPVMDARFA